ncbi:AAA family ATPase [Candidatus Latescibacterota bacterium]
MTTTGPIRQPQSYWFVGATYGPDDQLPRFLMDGIWQNGYEDRYLDLVRSMEPGDRIAVKAAYTRKLGLPFESRGHTASVMAIKAIGTITENTGDGQLVKVAWTPLDSPREWYFYTYRAAVWRVTPGDWLNDALIAFAFEGQPQDVDRFRNQPYWRERFGDAAPAEPRFGWTQFYEALADRLLTYRDRRPELVAGIHQIAKQVDAVGNLTDQFVNDTSGPLEDVCPFTTFGTFNRGITDANRKAIAEALRVLTEVEEPIPQGFDGIPIVNNMQSWFFRYSKDRGRDDIDRLWDVFSAALRMAGSDDPEDRVAFEAAFDAVSSLPGVGWKLTIGLYWVRPWAFAPLDSRSREYITSKLGLRIGEGGAKGRCSGREYLRLLDVLGRRFEEEAFPVHSHPELSLAAWQFTGGEGPTGGGEDPGGGGTDDGGDGVVASVPLPLYSLDNILEEGCFLDRTELSELLGKLRMKKNLILQGPPGTGKTWLARRLAFALVGHRDDRSVRAVQFHANLSYEDFVRGWRPSGDGALSLEDGPLMEMIDAAREDSEPYVLVIEEINRGNPAQILGEMLTLLESDKRTPSEALELSYRRHEGERVYIPDNLYVIGTMNIADRSIALVDLALRRRFAFADLEPQLGAPWKEWLTGRFGMAAEVVQQIETRLLALNEEIAADEALGSQFRIGHSYVTPAVGTPIPDARIWFRRVVEGEIAPLLAEYWYDQPSRLQDARNRLFADL